MSVLKVNEVSKSFENEEIIENISLELHQGEIVSLLGVSGGGKTTLFNIIAGLSVPDKGNVYLDGSDITGKPGNISYMLQKDLLLPYRTIIDNVALPLIIRGSDIDDDIISSSTSASKVYDADDVVNNIVY